MRTSLIRIILSSYSWAHLDSIVVIVYHLTSWLNCRHALIIIVNTFVRSFWFAPASFNSFLAFTNFALPIIYNLAHGVLWMSLFGWETSILAAFGFARFMIRRIKTLRWSLNCLNSMVTRLSYLKRRARIVKVNWHFKFKLIVFLND